jgi:hypothetical protein
MISCIHGPTQDALLLPIPILLQAALRLYRMGLRFIGTGKTATKEFPMNYLGTKVMADGRGDRYGLVSKDGESGCQLLALCWVDRD